MDTNQELTRRTFLGAVTAAPLFVKAAHGAQSDITCGIIGTGNRGRNVLRSTLQIPNVKITGLCDTSDTSLDQAMEIVRDHKPQLFHDYTDLLKMQNLDAVIVATPCYLHAEHAVPVLESGRHCFLEKPMGVTVKQVFDIEHAVRRSGRVFQIGQQRRYDIQLKKIIGVIHSGAVGTIACMRAGRTGREYPKEKLWINIAHKSGDVIVEQAVHNIDVCNWVMGSVPVQASGSGGQVIYDPEGKTNLDYYSVIFDYPHGRHVQFFQTKLSTPQTGAGHDIVYGAHKSINMRTGEISIRVGRDEDSKPPIPMDLPDRNDYTVDCMRDFFSSIRENRQPYNNVEVGKSAALTALLGRKAIYERRTVTWQELMTEDAPLYRTW